MATACHNCVDGLTDVIKHYKINIPVRNVCEYVADATVLAAPLFVPPASIPAAMLRQDRCW